jgi:hypothetical protein
MVKRKRTQKKSGKKLSVNTQPIVNSGFFVLTLKQETMRLVNADPLF